MREHERVHFGWGANVEICPHPAQLAVAHYADLPTKGEVKKGAATHYE